MTPRIIRTITFAALALCATLPAWGQQYLYTPQPVPADDKAVLQDGVLVQEIVIRKGDTLSRLSRKYSGRGMYYPQILLFNSIKNPDLIYSGRTLRVPVSRKSAAESINTSAESASPNSGLNVTENRNTRQKPEAVRSADNLATAASPVSESLAEKAKDGGGKQKKKSAARTKKEPLITVAEPQTATNKGGSAETAGSEIFEAATRAYRRDDCRTALELLDRFLASHSNSPNAAEADLYKADCYLKLSAQ